MAKQYGLTLPGKNKSNLPAPRASIFGDDSDSDDDGRRNVPTASQQNVIRQQDLKAQKKALEEDPTVYQYDEVYDNIETSRIESKLARKDIDKKPKYINRLLQTAARRKRENDRRYEREIQKERENEGDEFKDKEEFVTSAYRKKLEEIRELEELEKREDYLEAIGDVTKQADLGGFYRHLYEQQVKGTDDKPDKKDKNETAETSNKNKTETDTKDNLKTKVVATKDRKYRKHGKSASNSDSEPESTANADKLQHLQSNLDADSDFSIESSDSEAEPGSAKKVKIEAEEPEKTNVDVKEKKPEIAELKISDTPLEFEPEIKKEKIEEVEKKPKIDIWKKRTVGTAFDDALQRYYDRKNAKMNSG